MELDGHLVRRRDIHVKLLPDGVGRGRATALRSSVARRSLAFGSGVPLPPGSAVIVHSALVHGRRARPGGAAGRRSFTDVSYCQHSAGRHWASYQLGHRPGGRGDAAAPGGHADFCARHLALGHGTPRRRRCSHYHAALYIL
jgi:hypothetical protein